MVVLYIYLIWNAEILDSASSYKTLWHLPEPVTILWGGGGMRGQRSYWRTLEVQMTSLSCMFIQLSQLTRWPLYVSPFFSSTSYTWFQYMSY